MHPSQVVRLSSRLLCRSVTRFTHENPALVLGVFLVLGCMSGFQLRVLARLLGWMIVGILSSIGFGIGIPTRVLFVYPHILSIAAKEPSALVAWRACLPVAVSHAMGSALGELPPFIGSSMLVKRMSLDEGDNALAVSHRWFVQRMRSHGWFWVFAMAAWPNIAFDMAGLAAGASGMSLLTFLTAAITGKAFLRAPVASALVVGSVHSISWLPEFQLEPSSVGIAQWMWTLFVAAVSVVCMWWCAKEAAEEEMRRLSDRET